MKDYLLELTGAKEGSQVRLNTMREYLQAYVLRILHDDGIFQTTAFWGGTALRFLHNLPRFSEDLDFSHVQGRTLSFVKLIKKLKQELDLAGYNVSVTYNEVKTVQSAFVKFEGLLYEAGLSPLKKQKLSVKIEIDTNPPEGSRLEIQIINKYFPLAFLTFDLPSFFAGKVSALLSRKYTKGRDFFDLGWYLSRWRDIKPNIRLLHNALTQTGWTKEIPREDNWRDFLYQVVDKADWRKVHRDVVNFLENPLDMKVFTKENVLRLLCPNKA